VSFQIYRVRLTDIRLIMEQTFYSGKWFSRLL